MAGKSTEGKVLVGSAKGTPNPGSNHPNVLHGGKNGQGVGDNPAKNQPYRAAASENKSPMRKGEKVGRIVGN